MYNKVDMMYTHKGLGGGREGGRLNLGIILYLCIVFTRLKMLYSMLRLFIMPNFQRSRDPPPPRL